MDDILLIFINAPDTKKIETKPQDGWEEKRFRSIFIETTQKLFSKLQKINNVKTVCVYQHSSKYPDLCWLSSDDPGFLVQREALPFENFKNAVRWAYDAGAEKISAVWLDMFQIKAETLIEAHKMLSENHFVLGGTDEKDCYFIGFTKAHGTAFKDITDADGNFFKHIKNAAERLKLKTYHLPETSRIKDEKSYRQWRYGNRKPRSKKNQKELFEQLDKKTQSTAKTKKPQSAAKS